MKKLHPLLFVVFLLFIPWSAWASTFASSMTNNIVVAITDSGFGFVNTILNNVLQDQLLENYLDLVLRRFTDKVTATPVRYCYGANRVCYQDNNDNLVCQAYTGPCDARGPAAHIGTTGCDGGTDDYAYCTGWDKDYVLDTCMDIPLLGSACFGVALNDIDNDGYIVEFNTTTSGGQMSSIEGATNNTNSCAPYTPSDDDDAIQLSLQLKDLELDLEMGRPWATDADWANETPGSTRCDDYIYATAKAGTSLASNPVNGLVISIQLAPGLQHRQSSWPHSQLLSICAGDIYLDFSFQYDWVSNTCSCQDANNCQTSSGTNFCPDDDDDGCPDGIVNCSAYPDSATVSCSDMWCDCDNSNNFPAILPFLDAQFSAWFDDTISSALDYYVGCAAPFDLTDMLQSPHYNSSTGAWEGGMTHPIGTGYIGYDVAANAWYCYRPWGGTNNGGLIIGQANIDTYWLNALNVDPSISSNWVCDPGYNGYGGRYIPASNSCWAGGYIVRGTDYNPVLVQPPTNPPSNWSALPFTGNTVGAQAYDIGVALHEQVISEAIYEVLRDGLLSITLDKNTPTLGEAISSVLNTNIFGFFLPDLQTKAPDKDMRISIVPIFDATVNADKHRAWTTDNTVSIPRAIGGTLDISPDLFINMPRIYLDFSVDTSGSGTWEKIFRMEIDLLLGLGLEIQRCGAVNPPRCTTADDFRIFLGMTIDPDVTDIVETSNTIYPTHADYEDFMGDIFPILLGGIIGSDVAVTLNLQPILSPWNFSISAPVIGAAGDSATSDDDTTAGNYFAMYLKIWEPGVYSDNINAKFVLDVLEGHIDFGLNLGLAPPVSSAPPDASSRVPEAVIEKVEPIDQVHYGIYFTGFDDTTPADELKFSYRIDGSVWSPFIKAQDVAIPVVREGWHKVEVMAMDSDGFIDPTPAVYRFRTDRVGPELYTVPSVPAEVKGDSLKVYIYAHDWQISDDMVKVSYNLDRSGWVTMNGGRTLELKGLSEGVHLLELRALDDVGNETYRSYRFAVLSQDGSVSDGALSGASGFGCAFSSHGGTGFDAFLILIFSVGLIQAVLRKKMRG